MDEPVRLDRQEARRVLHRASERAESTAGSLEAAGDRFDEATVVAAAVEAGIPEGDVRRALAVERLGPAPAHQPGDGLLGAATVTVDDELAGSAADALARIDAWLVGGHHLRRDRMRAGRGAWSRRPGVVAATFRTVRHATGEGYLGEARRIDAAAADTGTGTCVVRVAVDRRRDRAWRAGAASALAAVGTGVAVAAAVVTTPVLLVAAPLAVAVGAGVAATGRGAAAGVEAEVTRLLGAVGDDARPSRLGVDVARRVIGRPSRPST